FDYVMVLLLAIMFSLMLIYYKTVRGVVDVIYYYFCNCHSFSRYKGLTCLEICNCHILLVRKPSFRYTMKTEV
ncbi:hypothetical protein VIGAN_10074900, partial [Vigna angularis var. angularis]